MNNKLLGMVSGWMFSSIVPVLAEEVVTLPEITVEAKPEKEGYSVPNATTATKTDTPIFDMPVSIQVMPQQVLKDQQVIRVEDAIQNVSGVFTQLDGFGGLHDEFVIRGFSTSNIYLDGFRIRSSTLAGKRETANLERIEVLKGPAAVLYGQVEPGGLINLVSKQPLDRPYYSLQQQFGSFDFYRTTFDATGPIIGGDSLLYRFNMAYENADSFRDFVENERVFVAPILRWNITDRTQATIELQYLHNEQVPDVGIPAIGDRPAPLPRERFFGQPFDKDESDEILIGFNWSHAFSEDWTLRHRFNAQFVDSSEVFTFFDFDFSKSLPAGTRFVDRLTSLSPDQDSDSYFTSLDLIGHFDTWGIEHTALIGADYYDFKLRQGRNFPSIAAIDLFAPDYDVPKPDFAPDEEIRETTTDEWYGIYVQDQIQGKRIKIFRQTTPYRGSHHSRRPSGASS